MWDDRSVTIRELWAAIGIGKPAVIAIIRELCLRNVGAENAHRRTQNSPEKTSVQNFCSTVTKTAMLFYQ
jgi:hypothetical protein